MLVLKIIESLVYRKIQTQIKELGLYRLCAHEHDRSKALSVICARLHSRFFDHGETKCLPIVVRCSAIIAHGSRRQNVAITGVGK